MFTIAVLGHKDSIEDIKTIIAEKFEDTQVIGIPLSSDEEVGEAKRQLEMTLPACNGVLYTRQDPYRLMISRVKHGDVPVRYVDIDTSNFIHSLMEASYHYRADICRVSVDTLGFETVTRAYESLHIPAESTHFRIISVDTASSHFVNAVAQTHRENYLSGKYSVCVTNIRNVWDTLRGENIPCVLMTPSRDSYIHEIRRLMISYQLKRSDEGNLAIMSLTARRTDAYIAQTTLVQNVLDRNRVNELVAYFTQRLDGACIDNGNGDYYIFCEYGNLARETDNFTKLDLMDSVFLNTPYALSVGIGIGKNMRGALANSAVGMRRAVNQSGNRAYIVRSAGHIIGPIEPSEITKSGNALFDRRLMLAANTCGMAINTVCRIDAFVRQNGSPSFTVRELARALSISSRTAARMVAKLERKGYAAEVGKVVTGDKGRPTRVFRLLW